MNKVTRYVKVAIDAEERACGKCRWREKDYYMDRWICNVFLTVKRQTKILKVIDGQPQRCAVCLAAELKPPQEGSHAK